MHSLMLVMLLGLAVLGRDILVWADLKTGPVDPRELSGLGICFGAGCVAQLAYLLSQGGQDKPHPWTRWVGEILLGGLTAYSASVGYLRYGPPVELPTLIVVAAISGFIGQRLLVVIAEQVLKKFGIVSKLRGEKDGS